MQFNYKDTEIGHIHINGLLDILLDRKKKPQLFTEGKIENHYTFINSGWVSFTNYTYLLDTHNLIIEKDWLYCGINHHEDLMSCDTHTDILN